MQATSPEISQLYEGKITYYAPDFCPVIGKSEKFNNLCYNFGISHNLFLNPDQQFNFYLFDAMQVSSIILNDLDIEKTDDELLQNKFCKPGRLKL